MYAEGWRRVWELTKWLVSLAVAGWVFVSVMPTEVPAPNATPTAGQILIGVLFMSGLAGSATFGLLYALEWVYRGFRPLPDSPVAVSPMVEAHSAPLAGSPESAPALQHPALPHPDNQQNP